MLCAVLYCGAFQRVGSVECGLDFDHVQFRGGSKTTQIVCPGKLMQTPVSGCFTSSTFQSTTTRRILQIQGSGMEWVEPLTLRSKVACQFGSSGIWDTRERERERKKKWEREGFFCKIWFDFLVSAVGSLGVAVLWVAKWIKRDLILQSARVGGQVTWQVFWMLDLPKIRYPLWPSGIPAVPAPSKV